MGLCDRRRGWGVRLLSPVGVRAAGEIERHHSIRARVAPIPVRFRGKADKVQRERDVRL